MDDQSLVKAKGAVRTALIGAGIFVRDAHLPSILRQPDHLRIVAVFSRDKQNASALAAQIPYDVAVTNDLTRLLEDETIECVIVALPIPVMPEVVAQCLQAGKHVLSEKPVAPTVQEAQKLLEIGRSRSTGVWMVGENWRYEDAFRKAAEIIQSGRIGAPLLCHWSVHSPFGPTSKYYATEWRRTPAFPGGLLLDGGVHHIAVLRMLLGEIAQVSAVVARHSVELTSVDTMSATLVFASGALGAYMVTYAASAPWPPLLHITGDKGTLCVQRRTIEVETNGQVEQIRCDGFDGVEKELIAFAEAIRQGTPQIDSALEATQDLAVFEAMLQAAEQGVSIAPARV